ncbi:MAG: ABC transporter ATP-binding protein [Bdellovibrionota bacterium]
MISATRIVKRFNKNGRAIINDISFDIANGEIVSIIGRSGSGKSTLLYMISTLDRSFDGEVLYNSKSIKKMGVEEIHSLRNLNIGFVFQFHYLLSELTALENVLLPCRKLGMTEDHKSFAKYLLKEVGLEDKEDSVPGSLSGGEQQRVAIARALILKPAYVFADEPTGNLDPLSGETVMKLFFKFNKEFGTSIVYVTHDQDFASMAPRKIHLVEGKI